MTPLHWSCKRNYFEMVQLLISYDADILAVDLVIL
jgi:ankyrin repeat protein